MSFRDRAIEMLRFQYGREKRAQSTFEQFSDVLKNFRDFERARLNNSVLKQSLEII